jgi:hypothetical protein
LVQRDFFSTKLEIFDEGSQILLGSGSLSLFNLKGEIVINGKRFELDVRNVWQSGWSWKFNGAELMNFRCNDLLSKSLGTIDVYTANTEEVEMLLLLGLLVRNQFISILVVLFIALLFAVL